MANGGFFIDAVLNGSEAVAIGTMTANPIYSLIVRPEIETYDDLRGRTITLTAPWDGITLTALALLARNGIGPDDFNFEAIRMSDARLECMRSGQCAAIIAVQPIDIHAIDLGLGQLITGLANYLSRLCINNVGRHVVPYQISRIVRDAQRRT